MTTTIFDLSRSGKLEPAVKAPQLPQGTIATDFDGSTWYVVEHTQNPNNDTFKLVSDRTQTIDCKVVTTEFMRPLSKKFGRGFYWVEPIDTVDTAKLLQAIERAEAGENLRQQKEKEKNDAIAAEAKRLPSEHPYLTPITADRWGKDYQIQAKANLVAALQHHFPGTRFSVRKDSYDTYYVRWTNGPCRDEVHKVTNKFQNHSIDFTGDYLDYTPSTFNDVFGGFKHVFAERDLSQDIRDLIDALERSHGSHTAYDSIKGLSIPNTAKNFRLNSENVIVFDVEEVKPKPTASASSSASGTPEIVDYSEKAVVVINSKSIAPQLKALGGKFKPYWSCGPGWMFSKKQLPKIEALIKSI